MAFVEEPHRRHEADAVPGRARLVARGARFGNGRHGDHRSLPPTPKRERGPSRSRMRASSRPLSRRASVASAQYAARSSAGTASRWRATVSASPRATGPVSASRRAERLDVVDGRAHQRPERFQGYAGVTGHARHLAQEGDEMVRGDRRRRVVLDPIGGRHTEGPQSERDRQSLHRVGALDSAPRAGQARQPHLDRRQRLQRVQRADGDVGPCPPQLVELVERARARQVDDQRAALESRGEHFGRLGDGGVGRGDEHERGAVPGVGDVDRRRAEPRGSTLRRWRGHGPARDADRRPPTRNRARPRRSCRLVRGPRGRAPAAIDGPRQSSSYWPLRPGLFVPAPREGAGLLGQHQC